MKSRNRTVEQGGATVQVLPVSGLPEVRAGDDLAALLHQALTRSEGAAVRDGDVLCVSAKVVSKALGLVVDPARKDEALAAETVRLVARRRHGDVITSVVQTPHGAIMAAAGMDASNSPDGLLLLPRDPDGEAERLRARLSELTGRRVGVLVTDTSSRIWRRGVGDIALGAAGVESLQDLRGGIDGSGRPLAITVRDLADEIAAAADLVKGKASRVPAAVVRGLPAEVTNPAAAVPAARLHRLPPEDWFVRPSLESVWQALGVPVEAEPMAAMEPEADGVRIGRALAVATAPRYGDPPRRATASWDGAGRVTIAAAGGTAADLIEAGVLAERVRSALDAESIASALPSLRVDVAAYRDDDGR